MLRPPEPDPGVPVVLVRSLALLGERALSGDIALPVVDEADVYPPYALLGATDVVALRALSVNPVGLGNEGM